MRGDMIEIYKYLNELYDVHQPPLELHDTVRPNSITRGNGYKLIKEKVHSKERINFFKNRVVNIWNSPINEIVAAPSLNAFKNRLDDYWKNYKYQLDMSVIQHRTNSRSQISLL